MNQLSLLDKPPPYQAHSPTSRYAATKMISRQKNLMEQVYDYILRWTDSGATDEEIQLALGLSGDTQRPRRVRLVELNRVYDSGRKRKTLKGRSAVVWVAHE